MQHIVAVKCCFLPVQRMATLFLVLTTGSSRLTDFSEFVWLCCGKHIILQPITDSSKTYCMLTQRECDILKSELHGTMVEAMQVTFLPSDDDIALCEMPITDTVRQYLGVLHGGAYLALAETIAGAGSLHLTGFDMNGKVCGTEVSGTHVAMSATHGKVYGKARLVYAGYSTHVWNVEINNSAGELISTVTVTNYVVSTKNVHQ